MEAVREKWTDDMNKSFDAIERLIIRGGAVLFVTLVVGFLSLALTQH